MKCIYGVLLSVLFVIAFTELMFAQWVQTSCPVSGTVNALTVSGTNIFAGTSAGGIYISIDDGDSWNAVNNGLTEQLVRAVAVSSNNIFAGTKSGVFKSTNNGNSWSAVDSGLTTKYVFALTVSDTNVFAGTYGGGVFISTNEGITWAATALANANINCLASTDSDLFAGRGLQGVYVSTDEGKSWNSENKGLSNTTVNAMVFANSNLYAGTYGGVFSYTSSIASWKGINSGLADLNVNALTTNNGNIFAGTYTGVYLLLNNDTTWINVEDGFSREITSLTVAGKYIFAGTYVSGLWRRPISEMITGVKYEGGNTPSRFALMQNYPNPFNPATTINYSIPKTSFVTIKVYDVLGKEITTLVNNEKLAGRYYINFNSSKLTSGVYFYRMQAGSFIETKKLIVLK